MDELLQLVVRDLIAPFIIAALMTGAAWLVARLPGPIRDSLQASVHQKDMQLLLGAMARRAAATVAVEGPGALTPQRAISAVDDAVAYARSEIPAVVAKLAPSSEALKTMAQAALVAAVQSATAAVPPVVPR